jgi:hypothetical protein
MADLNMRVPMTHLTKDLTMHVTVTGVHWWAVRQTIGIWLIRCAAWVMGVNIHVDMESR